MMRAIGQARILVAVLAGCFLGCALESIPVEELRSYALDNLDGLVSRDAGVIDQALSSDGNGSLRIEAGEPITVRLFEVGNVDVEKARLTYSARLRTEGLDGNAYLEMWCDFAGKGEYFSRALESPLSGTNDWASQQTPFFLKAGQNPDNVRLNLVIEGKGTVWIDEIKLLKGPLG